MSKFVYCVLFVTSGLVSTTSTAEEFKTFYFEVRSRHVTSTSDRSHRIENYFKDDDGNGILISTSAESNQTGQIRLWCKPNGRMVAGTPSLTVDESSYRYVVSTECLKEIQRIQAGVESGQITAFRLRTNDDDRSEITPIDLTKEPICGPDWLPMPKGITCKFDAGARLNRLRTVLDGTPSLSEAALAIEQAHEGYERTDITAAQKAEFQDLLIQFSH